MTVRKLSVSVPDWLEPIIREAADRDGVGVSAFLVEAAKTAIIEREAEERRRYEAAHGIDRRAQLEAAESAFQEDHTKRAGKSGVAGAA